MFSANVTSQRLVFQPASRTTINCNLLMETVTIEGEVISSANRSPLPGCSLLCGVVTIGSTSGGDNENSAEEVRLFYPLVKICATRILTAMRMLDCYIECKGAVDVRHLSQ